MRHAFILAAVAALALAGTAQAAHTPTPPYKADAKGNCHDKTGSMVSKSMCAAPAAKPAMASMKPTAKAAPHCVKGKVCGNTCIKATDVCHKS